MEYFSSIYSLTYLKPTLNKITGKDQDLIQNTEQVKELEDNMKTKRRWKCS